MKTASAWIAALAIGVCLPASADAHYLWLERDGNGAAKAYFGEWVDDVHEKAGAGAKGVSSNG